MAHPQILNLTPADTQLEAYQQPILQALADAGGRDFLLGVYARVTEIMRDTLKSSDRELDFGKTKYLRAILIQGNEMIAAGLITQPLPSEWQISDAGRRLLGG